MQHKLGALAPYICCSNTTTSVINMIIIIKLVTTFYGLCLDFNYNHGSLVISISNRMVKVQFLVNHTSNLFYFKILNNCSANELENLTNTEVFAILVTMRWQSHQKTGFKQLVSCNVN
jgi:hypothetical protein